MERGKGRWKDRLMKRERVMVRERQKEQGGETGRGERGGQRKRDVGEREKKKRRQNHRIV